MRSWFSRVTSNPNLSASSNRKSSSPVPSKKDPAPAPAPAPAKATRLSAPPPPRSSQAQPMFSRSVSHLQSPAGSGARASKVVGAAAAEAKETLSIGKPRRIPFSSIQAEAGIEGSYLEHGAPRTVRFQLPPSASPEPSPLPKPKARGSEYVSVTRAVPERERRPSLSPLPVPVYEGPYAYPYTYSPQYADTFAVNASVTANVGLPVSASPASYPPRIGPIKLLQSLNGGTFGASYVAHDQGTGRVICARVFKKARLSVEEKIKQGLLVEARCYKIIAAAQARDRAHLMELHGILQDEERVFFIMPLMQCDLLDALGAAGRLDRALVRRWIAQLALGIDALHRMGIIHRDIKPENILLDTSHGNVRIADFNAAFIAQGGQPIEDGEVYSQDAVGSQPYIAWETAQRRWYGKMVDWWALGCLMFDLLTNTILFKDHGARNTYAKWDRKLEGISYLSYSGDLTDEEESVISGLIDLHPCSRYQLRHLRHHTYFFDENRVNMFDMLLREPAGDLLTVGRSVHPSLLQVDDRHAAVSCGTASAQGALCSRGVRRLCVRGLERLWLDRPSRDLGVVVAHLNKCAPRTSGNLRRGLRSVVWPGGGKLQFKF